MVPVRMIKEHTEIQHTIMVPVRMIREHTVTDSAHMIPVIMIRRDSQRFSYHSHTVPVIMIRRDSHRFSTHGSCHNDQERQSLIQPPLTHNPCHNDQGENVSPGEKNISAQSRRIRQQCVATST